MDGNLMEVVEVEVTMEDLEAEVTVVEEENSHEEPVIHVDPLIITEINALSILFYPT
ncbi:hypothetical protein KI387_036431, partial [Taxus chinensis]